MFPQNGENVPRLRFAGFTGEWEVRKLGEVFEYASSKHTSGSFLNTETGYPLFDANKQIGNILNYDKDKPYISIIKDGAGVGRIEKRQAKTSVIATMGYLSPLIDFDFGFALLENINFYNFILGEVIPHIYYRDYKEYYINLPMDAEEQTTIGEFFRTLDNLITLHS